MKSESLKPHVIFLLFPVLFYAILPASVFAAEKTYTLEQCMEMALTRNPAVLVSVEKKNQAEWRKKTAYDDFLPKLNMDYSYTYLDNAYNVNANFAGIDELSVTVHNNYRMGLHIDQPLFTGYRLIESYRLADLGLKEAVAGEELATLEITYQTIRAYYNLLMSTQFQRVRDNTVTTLTSHLNDSQQFYKNEIIPLNDLLESEVYLANAMQDARTAASRTRNAKTNLVTIIKEPLNPDFTVEDSPDTTLITSSLDLLTDQALETRPELKQANYGVDASKKLIVLAKSTYFP
ncbi:MAG: TolC family protein, partial [Proteobacteria bacterium]|nr:TolC family protein [Pseudomonadota bacterium]